MNRTVLGHEHIGDRALELLLAEPADERAPLIEWAAGEFRRFGLGDPSAGDARQFVLEAIWENPMLGDWMSARGVDRENVLSAESFAELIDWLTPAYGDR